MYRCLNNTTTKEKISHAEYFANPKSPRKRAHNTILMSFDKLNRPIQVPWLNNKTIQIVWTP